jgi:hypothetical protein
LEVVERRTERERERERERPPQESCCAQPCLFVDLFWMGMDEEASPVCIILYIHGDRPKLARWCRFGPGLRWDNN